MSSNAYDFDTMQQIEILAKELGGIPECKRLGFVFEDSRGILTLSVSGLGYLLLIRAGAIRYPAEAFAAGYQCAHEEVAHLKA